MAKPSRFRHENLDAEQPQPQAVDDEAWDAPAFHRSVLVSLAFVAAPAIVMIAVGERAIAAAWFGVGLSVIIFGSLDQLRSLWRSLRGGWRED